MEMLDMIRGSKKAYAVILTKGLVYVFTIITVLAFVVPFNPEMPHSGLDPSWVFSMNEVAAQSLSIGREIIFTFGPYASIYTRAYHPATDNLIFLGLRVIVWVKNGVVHERKARGLGVPAV